MQQQPNDHLTLIFSGLGLEHVGLIFSLTSPVNSSTEVQNHLHQVLLKSTDLYAHN